MLRYAMSLAAAVLMMVPATLTHARQDEPQKKSVAVFDVRATDAIRSQIASGGNREESEALEILLDSIRAAMPGHLTKLKKFDVVATGELAAKLEAAIPEWDLRSANAGDPRTAGVYQALGVSHVLTVNFENFDDSGTITNGNSARRTIAVATSVNILEAETMKYVANLTYRPEIDPLVCSRCVDRNAGKPFGNEEFIKIGDDIAAELAGVVLAELNPMKVFTVSRRGDLVVNVGAAFGQKKGDVYDIVIREGFEDPDTGDVIFAEEPIGEARIKRVTPTTTSAEIVDGDEELLEEIREIIAEKDQYYHVVLRKPQG